MRMPVLQLPVCSVLSVHNSSSRESQFPFCLVRLVKERGPGWQEGRLSRVSASGSARGRVEGE